MSIQLLSLWQVFGMKFSPAFNRAQTLLTLRTPILGFPFIYLWSSWGPTLQSSHHPARIPSGRMSAILFHLVQEKPRVWWAVHKVFCMWNGWQGDQSTAYESQAETCTCTSEAGANLNSSIWHIVYTHSQHTSQANGKTYATTTVSIFCHMSSTSWVGHSSPPHPYAGCTQQLHMDMSLVQMCHLYCVCNSNNRVVVCWCDNKHWCLVLPSNDSCFALVPHQTVFAFQLLQVVLFASSAGKPTRPVR